MAGGALNFNSALFSQHGSGTAVTSVYRSKRLQDVSSLDILLGNYVDGLPLVLRVRRSMSHLTRFGSLENVHPTIQKALQDLTKAINARGCVTGIYQLEDGTSYYRTSSELTLRPSILGLLLQDKSALRLNELGENYQKAREDSEAKTFIGVPLQEEAQTLFKIKTYLGTEEQKQEPLILEDLSLLPNMKFKIFRDAGQSFSGYGYTRPVCSDQYEIDLLSNREAYLRALSKAGEVQFLFSVEELLRLVIIPVAKQVHESWHSRNRVHGDIRPSNILLTKNGPVLVESAGPSVGNISAVYTAEWSAPEQILGKPISTAADVYSLASIVLSIFGGQIYGEIKNFRMPAVNGSSVIEVLHADGIWLDPSLGLPESTRNVWKKTLLQYLSFEETTRPSDALDFANALTELLESSPLTGLQRLVLSSNNMTVKPRKYCLKSEPSEQIENPELLRVPVSELQPKDVQLSFDGLPLWEILDQYSVLQ